MRAIDFEDHEPQLARQTGERLAASPKFVVERWALSTARPASERAAFAIFVCLEGTVRCGEVQARPGDFFLVPACAAGSELQPSSPATSLLRITLPTR